MLKTGKLLIEMVDRKPSKGELGISGANLMYYNDGNSVRDRLPEYKRAQTLLPRIVDEFDNGKILVQPCQFTTGQLYAIMNKKLLHEAFVAFIVDGKGQIRLNDEGKVTLVPYNCGPYDREYIKDMLYECMTEVRANPKREINIDTWFDNYNTKKKKVVVTTILDTDEDLPEKIK
jgi:hypothetical protein